MTYGLWRKLRKTGETRDRTQAAPPRTRTRSGTCESQWACEPHSEPLACALVCQVCSRVCCVLWLLSALVVCRVCGVRPLLISIMRGAMSYKNPAGRPQRASARGLACDVTSAAATGVRQHRSPIAMDNMADGGGWRG
jgi:hypothetical protein